MSKTTRAQRREKAEAASRKQPWGFSLHASLAALVTAVLVAAATAYLRSNAGAVGNKDERTSPSEDGLGPSVMREQGPLLRRLIGLLKQVEDLPGEERWDERMAVSRRVEAELKELQADIDDSSAGGKQHLALIALALSALQDDRNGKNASATEENWSDEKLYEAHGLVTYASKSYWDEAYGSGRYGETYDWFGGWEEPDSNKLTIAEVFRQIVDKEQRILMLGSGISNMSALMYGEGYRNIVNVDVSEPAVLHMKKKWSHLEDMEWKVMDASALDLASESFDVVVEKGLFDALFAGAGTRVAPVLSEASRVLRSGGRLLSITFGDDRIQRLFMPNAGATTAAKDPLHHEADKFNCTVAGELRFASRKREIKSQHQEAGKETSEDKGKPIYVYSCEKI